MTDAIQKGIEAAQQDLVKETEEKLLEEVHIYICVVYCTFNFRLEQLVACSSHLGKDSLLGHCFAARW